MSLVIAINGSFKPYQYKEKPSLKSVVKSHKSDVVEEFSKDAKPSRPYSKKLVSSYNSQENLKQRDKEIPRVYAYQIMSSPVISIEGEQTVQMAKILMSERRIRHLPVVENGLIRGIISNEDILMSSDDKKVNEIMKTEVLMAYENAPIDLLSRILIQNRVGAIPIIDHNKQLKGIVTTIDILKYVQESFPLRINI
ncbi:MAG: CBS domain-containing protein [Bdellovibrionales bacterium]|nr:CBS domain-containing protein [Bdellovibrionales bacterium]